MDKQQIIDWAKEKAKAIAISLAGLVAMLGYWTMCGSENDPGHSIDEGKIPSQIWEGGSNEVSIEADTNTQGVVSVSFEGPDPERKDDPEANRWHEAWEKVEPGHHSYTIAFPEDTLFSTIEMRAEEPKVGDEISWVVKFNGEVINEDKYVLDKPLQEGYGMALQVELEEWLAGGAAEEDEEEYAEE